MLLAGLCAQVAAQAQMRGMGVVPGVGAGGFPAGGLVIPPPPLPPPGIGHLPFPPPPFPTSPPWSAPWPTPIPTAPPVTVAPLPPSAPPLAQPAQEQDEQSRADDVRRQRLLRVQQLWGSLQPLMQQNRGEELLRTLDELVALLEEDGGFPQDLARMQKLRNDTRLSWAGTLSEKGRPDEAVAVLRQATPSAERAELLAKVLFAAHRIAPALAALNELADFDSARATRLRGYFFLQLGAVPLAVEQFEGVSGAPDVARVLRNLQQKGLRQFRREERAGWVVYQAQANTGPTRTLAFWLPLEGGTPDLAHASELSVRPAPRKLTFGLILHHLLHLRWPSVREPREYELAVHGPGVRHVVALWEWEPDGDEITEAARRGQAALDPLRQAEEELHAGRREEALRLALEQARTPGWWLPPQPHYKALAMAIQAAVESGDPQAAQKHAGRLAGWHPMWAALELARAWDQAQKPELARAAYDGAIAAAPLRREPLGQLAEFEWGQARAAEGQERPPAFMRAQATARRLQAVDASAGLWLRVQIAYELEAHARASSLLRQLNQASDAPDAALELQALLQVLGQWDFTRAGESVPLANGLALQAWRSREHPPEDAALKHHGAEILVVDGDDDVVETFALTSQGVPPGAPRVFMLDRINAYGLQQLRSYGERPPALDRILKGVAAL